MQSKTVFGPENPGTQTSMAHLASTYQKMGRWTETEKLEVQVMEARKTVLGPEHPDTLMTMWHLSRNCTEMMRLYLCSNLVFNFKTKDWAPHILILLLLQPWFRWVDTRLPMLVRVSGCSGPSTVLDVSITCTRSFSASVHRPFLQRVDAMSISLSGWPGLSTSSSSPSLAQTALPPPPIVPNSKRLFQVGHVGQNVWVLRNVSITCTCSPSACLSSLIPQMGRRSLTVH